MIKRKSFKISVVLSFIFICIFSFTITSYADMGPKDQLIIHVKNPPEELYYLDLLIKEDGTYKNFNESEKEALNQEMLSLLYSYKNDGWKPAFIGGSNAPLWGNPAGEAKGNEMVHEFNYFGVPHIYRIIIVTESGKVSVSDVYTRKVLQDSITYDYNTGKAVSPKLWLNYLIQFISTFIPTLLIEGIILIVFGFKIKENWMLFIIVNFITQIFLTLTLGITFIQAGPVAAFFMQFPVELVILIAETLIYGKFLKGKTIGRRCVYSITANITSCGIGFLFLIFQYQFINVL
jgi:hypothetical protein